MARRIDCDQFPTQNINIGEWFPAARPRWNSTHFNRNLDEMWERPTRETEVVVFEPETTLEERFLHLAADWSESTAHISSINDLTSHPSYLKIIQLGWDVVPLLLGDLQKNQRFWFPALNAITKLRPFDPSDAGNGRRMTEAWIQWGKRKGLI